MRAIFLKIIPLNYLTGEQVLSYYAGYPTEKDEKFKKKLILSEMRPYQMKTTK
jgi:hypothetical protein